jgi:hypothetical protein
MQVKRIRRMAGSPRFGGAREVGTRQVTVSVSHGTDARRSLIDRVLAIVNATNVPDHGADMRASLRQAPVLHILTSKWGDAQKSGAPQVYMKA